MSRICSIEEFYLRHLHGQMWFSKTLSVRLQESGHWHWETGRGTSGRNERIWCFMGTWVRRRVKFIIIAKDLAETIRYLEYRFPGRLESWRNFPGNSLDNCFFLFLLCSTSSGHYRRRMILLGRVPTGFSAHLTFWCDNSKTILDYILVPY